MKEPKTYMIYILTHTHTYLPRYFATHSTRNAHTWKRLRILMIVIRFYNNHRDKILGEYSKPYVTDVIGL